MGLDMEKYVDSIVLSNLDYIKKNALKYVGYGVSYDDLVQISCESLLKAIYNYKGTRNFKEYFNIYIHHYLTEAIIKANCNHSVACSYYVDIFKILKAHKCGCVSLEEIRKSTSLSIDRIKECVRFINRDISLCVCDLCDVDNVEIEVISNLDDYEIIRKFFKNTYITDKEKTVLKMRYGFCGKIYSLCEIADILGISHQRVSILEKQGIYKFRKFLLIMGLAQISDFQLKSSEIRKLMP